MLVRRGIDRLAYLPCEKLGSLTARLPREISVWHLTRESAGVSLAFGWALGGGRPALLIQSTGLGNLITELLTLPVLYGLPLPILVSWRGHYRETIAAQTVLGERLIPMLRGLEISTTPIETPEDLPALEAALERCFDRGSVEVLLLSPRLWEGDRALPEPEQGTPRINAVRVTEEGYDATPSLSRWDAIRLVADACAEDEVLVAQIGFPARELFAARDRPRNVYLLGALGSATLVGLGLAQVRPDLRVTVLDGDGAFILNPNQMLEMAQSCPANLRVVLLDNGAWGSTGSQPTMTSRGLNLAALGAAVGMPAWKRVSDADDWRRTRATGARLVHFLIRAGNASVDTISLAPHDIRERFQRAISL